MLSLPHSLSHSLSITLCSPSVSLCVCLTLTLLCLSLGLSLWQYLREASFAEELSLWRCFLRHKVVLSCGQAFSCSTPGWFRIVFTQQQRHLQLGQCTQQQRPTRCNYFHNGLLERVLHSRGGPIHVNLQLIHLHLADTFIQSYLQERASSYLTTTGLEMCLFSHTGLKYISLSAT